MASDARRPQAYMTSSSARSRSAGGSAPSGWASSLAISSRERTWGSLRLWRGALSSAVGSSWISPVRRRWRWNERRQATLRWSVAGLAGGLPSRPSASSDTNPARPAWSSASGSRPVRRSQSPNWRRSERYASSVLRDRPRSNSRYARKSSTRCSYGWAGLAMATPGSSPGRRGSLRVQRRVQRLQPAAQLEQADQRLGVARLVDQRVELGQRAGLDVDALVLVRLGLGVRQARREVDVALLVGEAGRGVERRQV